MKQIRLTQDKFTKVDNVDIGWISSNKWFAKRTTSKNHSHGSYYAACSCRMHGSVVTVYLHRVIMDCPLDMEVDHINGDSLDNRRENLRICSRKENIAQSVSADQISGRMTIPVVSIKKMRKIK